ncbi:MAG: hypothetical protein V3T83_09790 [Acidobacteriota bacterium]
MLCDRGKSWKVALAAGLLGLLGEAALAESAAGSGPPEGYVGRNTCAGCHKAKAELHFASPHRHTWKPVSALDDMPGLPQEASEGPIRHRVSKVDGKWSYTAQLPGRPAQIIPIHSIMGGERFGTSFILRAEEIEGRRLPAPTLIEGRFMIEAGTHRLKKSPGLFKGQPTSYDTALGRVLSPDFAAKCLGCHTGPVDVRLAQAGGPHPQFGDVGVTCEQCHGPGADHVRAAESKEQDLRIVHPGKLSNPDLHKICSQCHSGFFSLVRPRPEDVLISNQVTALTSSECYIQSGAGLSCLDCHDPHSQAVEDDSVYEAACRNCHTPAIRSSAICPVNPMDGCIPCHMPANDQPGNFHLVDHWIRVVRR